MTNIIGLSAHFHDSAVCLLQNGVLIAAAQEERFSRQKHDPEIPKSAFKYCLRAGGISIEDLDCIAFFENPVDKFARQIYMMSHTTPCQLEAFLQIDGSRPEREIRELLGYEGPIEYFSHHQSHAASAFYWSGFAQAAILTVDGVGEWETTGYGQSCGEKIELFESVKFPNSLGLLYSAVTGYLGFEVNEGEYKVMGLAPYGKPLYKNQIRALVKSLSGGQYRLNLEYFDFHSTDRLHSDEMISLLGAPPRVPGSEIHDYHKNLACSLQFVLEEILLEKANYLHERTGTENLCMAGGVALNCVANSRILRDGPFRNMFVQPAAGDAGGCLGAAALAHRKIYKAETHPAQRLTNVYLGPSYSNDEIDNLIKSAGIEGLDFREREWDLLSLTADLLAEGKVIGWFHGRMEFGPRSLGARSILADPRKEGMRDRINSKVKQRENFRPFAPAVLELYAPQHFDIDHQCPFMMETCKVISAIPLPAITHIDGSARVQTVGDEDNPRFASLIKAFERRTGCPILLNTSFNLRGEPIVCTPLDALVCFIRSQIDVLVLEDFVIHRRALGAACQVLLRDVELSSKPRINHHTYTFI